MSLLQDAPISESVLAPTHAGTAPRLFIGPMPYSRVEANSQSTDRLYSQNKGFVKVERRQVFLEESWNIARPESAEGITDQRQGQSIWRRVKRKIRKMKSIRSLIRSTTWMGETFEVGEFDDASVDISCTVHPKTPIKSPVTVPRSPSTIGSPCTANSLQVYVTPSETPKTPLVVHQSSPSSSYDRKLLEIVRGPPASPEVILSQATRPKYSPSNHPIHTKPKRLVSSFDNGTVLEGDETGAEIESWNDARSIPSRHRTWSTETPPSPLTYKKSMKSKQSISLKGKGKAVQHELSFSDGHRLANSTHLEEFQQDSRVPNDSTDPTAVSEAKRKYAPVTDSVDSEASPDQVVMKDRMLIRAYHYKRNNLKATFDENDCRITRGIYHEEWNEFLVIWRNKQLEIYEDYERSLGHKHLAFVVPLDAQTNLSIFSHVDLSFVLTCSPAPTKLKRAFNTPRSIFHRDGKGLNVFIFKLKTRSRSINWACNLWTELGGSFPKYIEVNCPIIRTSVKIPLPIDGSDRKILSRSYILDQCRQLMEDSLEWKNLVQKPIQEGKKLELCWKAGTTVDWMWLKDAEEHNRDWELLYGLTLRYPGKAQLEMHITEHYPEDVLMKDGGKMKQPAHIEGYVYVIKRKARRRAPHYLITYDGYLCSIPINKVDPPIPPSSLMRYSKDKSYPRRDEAARLRSQIMNTNTIWDLRNVLVVRRILDTRDPVAIESEHAVTRRADSDIADSTSGNQLGWSENRARIRMHRSFEIILNSGQIFRFEAHSSENALKWVTNLRANITYWAQRRREDVKLEMSLLEAGYDKVTASEIWSKKVERQSSGNPLDAEDAILHLNKFWNWCILDGCRPFAKSGELFVKSKLRGQYTRMQLILTSGYLIQFRASRYTSMHYHHAVALPPDEYDANAPTAAKIFKDGFISKDSAEDTLFLLWYYPKAIHTNSNPDRMHIPAIGPTRKLLICRAKSILDRDSWCWALNCEIEKSIANNWEEKNIE